MGSYYNSGNSQSYYGAPGAPQPTYDDRNSYQPPRDDSYRHDMAVARYDDERSRFNDDRYDEPRRSSRSFRNYDDDDSRYDDRRSEYRERDRYSSRNGSRRGSSSRRSERDGERGLFGGEEHKDHRRGKDVGATLVGGAVGAFAGHEFGKKNAMITGLGALAGAFAGHELEKRHEKKKERRESEQDFEYRRDSASRGVDDDYEDDGYDRRRHHSRRDSGRYE